MKGVKSLLTGLGVTMKEYFIPKVTDQYPKTARPRCTCLSATADAL